MEVASIFALSSAAIGFILAVFQIFPIGWPRRGGSLILHFSFAKEPHKNRALLLQIRSNVGSLHVVATTYTLAMHVVEVACVVVCCSVLQAIAMCCSVLQVIAECCSVLQYFDAP